MSDASFAATGLEVDQRMAAAFQADGITEPTPIQQVAIQPILEGKHVIIHSGTGTGKTLSYLLPILQRLRDPASGRALVFAPATELALQTLRVADRYKPEALATGQLVATANPRKQKVQQSTRLVVGTTGRILEQFRERKLKGITMMVLDEPDPILASRDAEYLREILRRPEPKVQLILAGATLGAHAQRLATDFMGKDVVHTKVESNPLHDQITHRYVRALSDGTRDVELAKFLEGEKCERAIVFVNQPNLLRHLYRYLTDRQLAPVSLSDDRGKLDRQNALRDFTAKKARVLLTTDQAMTGIDIADVEWVLHYELPTSALAYVHRAGRTGRAGKSGRSVAIITRDEKVRLERIGEELGVSFTEVRGSR